MRFSDKPLYRAMEVLPGLLVWITFVGAFILSRYAPVWVMYFFVVFSVFWLFRVVNYVVYVMYCYRRFLQAKQINWLKKCEKLPGFSDIYHVVLLPTYKEPLEVLETTFEHLVKSHYPKDKMMVCLAGEERDKEQFSKIASVIQEKYGNTFFKFFVTTHPANIVGEIKGKASNMAYAIRQVHAFVDEKKIPYEHIIVSAFDCDTIVHPHYFGHLTHTFLTIEEPTRASYQPMIFYDNNIWDAPAVTRIAAFGSTFWLMTELSRPERLVTFSSHSMSFKALVDVGYWEKDVVSEDSRIFFQCLLKYHGNYRVHPLYLPLSLDTVDSQTYLKSLKNLYVQQRRWAYGVEHFPYLVWFFFQDKKMSLKTKLYHLFKQTEGMYTWAVVPILLFLLGRLPFWLGPSDFQNQVIAHLAPEVVNFILTLAMMGLVVSLILSMLLLPKRPESHPKAKYLFMLLQWLLLPLTLIIFGSFPAIDAQTRLMLGRYLGFTVTEKKR